MQCYPRAMKSTGESSVYFHGNIASEWWTQPTLHVSRELFSRHTVARCDASKSRFTAETPQEAISSIHCNLSHPFLAMKAYNAKGRVTP